MMHSLEACRAPCAREICKGQMSNSHIHKNTTSEYLNKMVRVHELGVSLCNYLK